MKVWIDMTAPAHVLVFRPLIEIMRERGDEVEITARDYAQTVELLGMHGLEADAVIGTHAGRSRVQKIRQMTGRLGALQALGEGPRLRRRARARLPRADDHGAAARHPELDDVRLRVRDVPAPARLPRRDAGRRPRRDPARAARAVRRQAAEARPVPGPEGGVLPRRLHARPLAARGVRRRPGARARRPAPAARRVALPPPLEPALPADARASRPLGGRAGVRPAAHRRAAGVRARARACRR